MRAKTYIHKAKKRKSRRLLRILSRASSRRKGDSARRNRRLQIEPGTETGVQSLRN